MKGGFFIKLLCLIPGCFLIYSDIKKHILYDVITLPLLLAGFLFAIYSGTWKQAMAGAGVAFLIFFFVAWTIGGVGGGDIKLAAALGMWFGYPGILLILILGLLLGIIWYFYHYYLTKNRNIVKQRITPFFHALYAEKILKINGAVSRELNDLSESEGIPLGAFLIISSWIVFLGGILIG